MVKTYALNLLKQAITKTKCYNLRLFYFSIYCFLLIGCGKKVESTPTNEDIQRAGLNTSIVKLESKIFTTGDIIKRKYDFETDSEVRIPDVIKVTEGNAGNNQARIYFNQDSSSFGFYCNYLGGASSASPINPDDFENGKMYYFDRCYTIEGDLGEINYYPGYESIQYEGKSVEFQILSADPRFDTSAEAEIEVNFH